jgi:serine/threonine protein kinase
MFAIFKNALIGILAIGACLEPCRLLASTFQGRSATTVFFKDELRNALKKHNNKAVLKFLTNPKISTTTFEELQAVARDVQSTSFSHALEASQKCVRLHRGLGLSLHELVALSFFCEVLLEKQSTSRDSYFFVKNTGLSRDVEYDPKTNYCFIHLSTGTTHIVGGGAKKEVTRSILYDKNHPKLVARCMQKSGFGNEVKMTKSLQGEKGVVQFRAYTKQNINGIRYHTLFCKLYKNNTIASIFNDEQASFTFREKLAMAYSVVCGLEEMKKKGLVHRDLHTHNFLLNITKDKKTKNRKIDLVIADFGLARFAKKTKNKRAHGDSKYSPPEAFLKPLEGSDYFKTDLFAVGCVLYRLYYEKIPSWQLTEYPKSAPHPKERAKRLYALIEEDTGQRRRLLDMKKRQTRLTSQEELESVILDMVHPLAKKRISAERAKSRLEILMKNTGKRKEDESLPR